MGEGFTIISGLDARYESTVILERMAKPESDAQGDMASAARYYADRDEMSGEVARVFEPLISVYEHVARGMEPEREAIERYFSSVGEQSSIEDMVLFADSARREINARNGDGESELYSSMLAGLSLDDDAQTAMDFAEFANVLDASGLSAEKKWAVISAASRFEDTLKEINSLIDRAEALYNESAKVLEPLAAHAESELRKRLNEQGPAKFLKALGITLDCDRMTFTVSAMRFNAVAMQSNASYAARCGVQELTVLHYGALFDWLSARVKNADNADAFLRRRLRALDDKNRFAILCELKKATMSAQEIIALTGLSAATVSHHMNELLETELIVCEKRGVSMYYGYRREGAEQLLAQLGEKLL